MAQLDTKPVENVVHARTETTIQRRHVLVVGIAGSGKTSLIKLLCKTPSTEIQGRGTQPTVDINTYSIVNNHVEYIFFDTPGFGGANQNVDGEQINPLAGLFLLLGSKNIRFDCVIYVWKQGRIDDNFHRSFSMLKNNMIRKSTPFILVVTECELEDDIHVYAASIEKTFINVGFDKVICGTTLISGKIEAIIRDIRENMCTKLWVDIDELCERIIIDNEDARSVMANQQSQFTEHLISWLVWAWNTLRSAAFVGKEIASGLFEYVWVSNDTSTHDIVESLKTTNDTHVSLSSSQYDINQTPHRDHRRHDFVQTYNNLQRSDLAQSKNFQEDVN